MRGHHAIDGEASPAAHAAEALPVETIGSEIEAPCLDGRSRRYVNLDHAASTPALAGVWEAVQAFVPWYSSVHRGSGLKSQVATAAFEGARAEVGAFVGARPDDCIVLVRNTTEALNVLATAFPAGTRVLCTPVEHHANLLPWRRHDVTLLDHPRSAADLLDQVDAALRAARPAIDVVAVTGASNVTGEVWPLAALAELAHRHGAELAVDAAQLAPHRPIDMAHDGIDHLAFSGHKLYAPFGAGALISRPGRLCDAEPLLRGGGAVDLVGAEDVLWASAPARHEAGSPDVVGAVALGAACRILTELGMDRVAEHERALTARLQDGLATVPGLRSLTLWDGPDVDRVGLATFELDGFRHPLLSAVLSAEHAIGVRHGCFCAHLLVTRLLGLADADVDRLRTELRQGRRPPMPGAVRASLGLGSTATDVDALVDALHALATDGPRHRYEYVAEHDEYRPAGGGPAWPRLPFALATA